MFIKFYNINFVKKQALRILHIKAQTYLLLLL
mgnify:CR=1 FL=1